MADFFELVNNSYKENDVALISKALSFAIDAHKDQKRLSGEPYIIHPINVSQTLIKLGLDASTIAASLLHDVLEDTTVTEQELESSFGKEILGLIQGVTKLSRIKFNSQEEEQAENIRKLFIAMAKDMRVLMIKLSDRLHNMRTLSFMIPEKQLKISRETLDIYAPLAGRLGISNIKIELEDLAMKYLFPDDYKYLSSVINVKRDERMGFVARITQEIESQLTELSIKGEVKGRPKHFYSIYKKMKAQEKTIEQIYDLIAIRVIVETIRDCYTVLGVIHSIWKPIPGRFKDYIAMPKPNMYQSLHTTVVTNFGQTFEIQIRTYEMNRVAEYGIAAHWKYKEGKSLETLTDLESRLGWIKEVMDVQSDLKDSKEFIDTLKLDVFSNEIYVFSPKGDVFNLTTGATCVDFAYRVHSAVGNKCVGAKVNNKIVALNTTLQLGDVVEILTSNNSKGPSRDWIKFIKTPSAKAKIRAFFKKEMAGDNIKTGKEMLEREAKHRGFILSDLLHDSYLKVVFDRYSYTNIDEMYASVGYGGITTNQILVKLIDCHKKDVAYQSKIITTKEEVKFKKATNGIIVSGFDDFLIRLSHCCNPVPGDEIVGYSSRGRGVSIHRKDCPNMQNLEAERIMPAEWEMSNNLTFTVILRVECEDGKGVLNQVISTVSELKLNISSVNANKKDKGRALMLIGIDIRALSDLDTIIKKVEALPYVIAAGRNA